MLQLTITLQGTMGNKTSTAATATTLTAKYVGSFGEEGKGDGQFEKDREVYIRVCPVDDSIWVARGGLQVFSPEGKFLRRFAISHWFLSPCAFAFDSDKTIIVCLGDEVRLYKQDSIFLRQIGRGRGKDEGQFDFPTGVTTDGKGLIFVVDQGNCRIQVFKRDGSFVRAFGKEGERDGEFKAPHDIAFAPSGELVVSDNNNFRIQVHVVFPCDHCCC